MYFVFVQVQHCCSKEQNWLYHSHFQVYLYFLLSKEVICTGALKIQSLDPKVLFLNLNSSVSLQFAFLGLYNLKKREKAGQQKA